MREIAYQTVEQGITTFLSASSKRIWPKFPLKVGSFTLLNVPHARKEETTLKELCLCIGVPRGHDPRGVVGEHIRALGLIPPFQHGPDVLDTIFQGVMSYEYVLANIQDNQEQENL
jgi:hypothetical protein